MSPIALHTVQGEGQAALVDLPLAGPGDTCSLRLRCLPGAAAVHLAVGNEQGLLLRAEMEAQGNEQVVVTVHLDEHQRCQVTSASRRLLLLPTDERYQPAPPITPAQSDDALDLALVIDGTSQYFWEDPGQRPPLCSRPLLQDPEQWPPVVEQLHLLLTAMTGQWADCRLALLAFADHAIPQVAARDLRPSYLLWPRQREQRVLRELAVAELVTELQELPPSSGGDYVDALADALFACSQLRWRPHARKIVLVLGDSPGHSVQHPVPRGGDGGVRALDVDIEAMRLHRCGVELLTVFLEPGPAGMMAQVPSYCRLLELSREQYRRLASLPSLAFRFDSFNPEAVARQLREWHGSIGRGATLPELLELLPGASSAAPPAC